jgi:large subunit ribosomal protein L18
MVASKDKREARERRHKRIRAKIFGTGEKPRLAMYKSNKYLYAELIDDEKGETLASASSKDTKSKTTKEKAREVGSIVAKKAGEKKISTVVFDRGGFSYTGIIKEAADSAREAGLTF